MDAHEILSKLKYYDGPFPKQGLEEATQHREMVVPELLEIIQKAIEEDAHILEREDYMKRIYSMYLLAQFREKQAYPLLIDYFSMPDEKVFELTGNMFIEDLGRILASVSCGDISLIQSLIENRNAHEFIRSSAIEALLVLVAVGEKSREEIIAYFQDLFNGKIEREPSFIWDCLVSCCVDLYPEELWEEINRSYNSGLVNESVIELEKVEDTLQIDREKALGEFHQKKYYCLVENVVTEMAAWSSFDKDEE
ncbi:MAG: DUF1186 domain-containing protein [Proteobacteria bacterium]|nr:DUF1186 domain-containing protein [Pseudomonadota bacterium]